MSLGCSQVVRHGSLTPAFVGSNPATPAILEVREHGVCGLFCCSKIIRALGYNTKRGREVMRKFVSVVLLLCFVLSLASCTGSKGLPKPDYFYLTEDGMYRPNLDDYTMEQLQDEVGGEFVIPDGAVAFFRLEGFKNVTKVVVPSTVHELPVHAFDGCTNLTEVVLPDTLTTMRGHTFENCPNITTLVIPKSLKTLIGPNDFYHCGITSYYFPAEVELENYTRDVFTQLPQESGTGEKTITCYVVEGSWMDLHFDELYDDDASSIMNVDPDDLKPVKAYWDGVNM